MSALCEMAVKAMEKPTLSTYAMKVAKKQAKIIWFFVLGRRELLRPEPDRGLMRAPSLAAAFCGPVTC